MNKPLPRLADIFYQVGYWLLVRSYTRYQPVYENGRLLIGNERNCLDRWALIKPVIQKYGAKTLLDLGSAEGFYLIQAANECGVLALGVDHDQRRLHVAMQQILAGRHRAGVLNALVNNELVDRLPKSDVVLCLSIFHHLCHRHGIEYCKLLLQKIRNKTGSVLIFEMGQSNESKTDYAWPASLPDMGADPHTWIANFLGEAGYQTVKKIGETPGYHTDIKRALFVAQP